MSIDINKQLAIVVKTGKVDLGCNEAVDAARSGKVKLIVLSRNCPEPFRAEILYNAQLSRVPVYVYAGSSVDLASACEKPFLVSAVSIKETGDSEIMKLAQTEKKK